MSANHVFINCPFDPTYQPIFDAIVFAVYDLGFVPRCAKEVDDGSVVRLAKIEKIIEQCRFGVHDISYVQLDPKTGLPRFNMPFELGMFLACKRFGGGTHRKKACLILDSEPYRFQQYVSDIAGQDIHSHGTDPNRAIIEVRNWLSSVSRRKDLPGGADIVNGYMRFRNELPALYSALRRVPGSLTFPDLTGMIEAWLLTSR